MCTAVNPHLTIKRAWFSTLIDRFSVESWLFFFFFLVLCCLIVDAFHRDIHNAAQNDLRDPDKRVADAVDVRQVTSCLFLTHLEPTFS